MAFLKFEISSPEKNFFSSPDFESKVRANPIHKTESNLLFQVEPSGFE